ncbi:LysR family transcriptional regulator [Cupriavidus gilardii]|uniref:LysR family transcriptional regulator n=1 Tax=Cupriavidus gilardii TaxID=82541 RepID=UPI0015721220|nr:LysR family transcriptional regulator [Cupriavidus gilardii]MCG5258845.1 LysR family transcriptional regulator [Cupriavidus gilardii]MDF9429359.1 LysR family transcriptional regulator [Cupriavidus gilardii]NSX04444.1 LysR family transcriptional regulator [Cupriavidus gilardii]
MIAQFSRILVPAAVSLVVGLSLQGAHAAPIDSTPGSTAARSHDVFSEGLRQGSFNPYSEGARNVDGDPRARGAALAGMPSLV